jgi:hypothetical protein
VAAELASEHGGDWQRLHGLVEEDRALGDELSRKLAEWEQLGKKLGL